MIEHVKEVGKFAVLIGCFGLLWGIIAKFIGITSSLLLYGISAIIGALAGYVYYRRWYEVDN